MNAMERVGPDAVPQRHRRRLGGHGFALLLVAADATGDLARLNGHEALHLLDREVVLIKGYEQHASHGRYFKVG